MKKVKFKSAEAAICRRLKPTPRLRKGGYRKYNSFTIAIDDSFCAWKMPLNFHGSIAEAAVEIKNHFLALVKKGKK